MARIFPFSRALLLRGRKGTMCQCKKTSKAEKFPECPKNLCLGKKQDVSLPLAPSTKQRIIKPFHKAITEMKEQIQQLIAAGQTKEALNLLVKLNPDALLLQAQYSNGEKQFNLGLIEFSEWGRIQARVNFAALEMAGESGKNDKSQAQQTTTTPDTAISSVFVSYNHDDSEAVERIRKVLEQAGLRVAIDTDDMAAGQPIKDFIQNRMKEKGFILSAVSVNSLRSGWVGIESDLSFYSQLFGGRQFLPVTLDGEFLKDDFLLESIDDIDMRLTDLDAKIQKAKDKRISALPYESRRNRLQELRENLPKILDRLQNVLTVDVSGDKFESGMKKVIDTIKGQIKG